MAQRLARVAHNHEDTGSKPVAGISPYRVHRSLRTFPRLRFKGHRRAWNSHLSIINKPLPRRAAYRLTLYDPKWSGCWMVISFSLKGRHRIDTCGWYSTGVAQRKRAGLIIPRSLVRTQSPVPVFIEFIALYGHRRHEDKNQPGIAQRQSVYNIVRYHMTSNGLNCEWLSPYKRKVTGSKPVTGNPVFIEFIALYWHWRQSKTKPSRYSSAEERLTPFTIIRPVMVWIVNGYLLITERS